MGFYRGPGGSGTGAITTLPVQITEGGTGATSVANARANLGLGTIALQNSNNISVTGGTLTGITDIAVADGGTGSSTAEGARVNLLPSYSGNGSKVLALNSGATDVEWTTNGNGTVTSVDVTVPTGLVVSGNPITTSGTFAISFDTGYEIPTTAKQTEWDTAYGWGDHSVVGYLTSETFTGTVTSVAATVPTGFVVSGSPITASGTLAISFDTGYALPTTASQSNWDTAYGWGDHASAGYLDSGDIGVTVQGYDADTAKYDDVTANFTGTLQNSGSDVVVDTDIGVTVQAYDADTAKYDDVTANFTGTLQNGGSNVVVDTDIGSTVQAYDATILKSADIGVSVQGYDADTAKYDDVTANFSGTLQNGGNTVLTTASTIEGGTY